MKDVDWMKGLWVERPVRGGNWMNRGPWYPGLVLAEKRRPYTGIRLAAQRED
jgi:hypothetical protein